MDEISSIDAPNTLAKSLYPASFKHFILTPDFSLPNSSIEISLKALTNSSAKHNLSLFLMLS